MFGFNRSDTAFDAGRGDRTQYVVVNSIFFAHRPPSGSSQDCRTSCEPATGEIELTSLNTISTAPALRS